MALLRVRLQLVRQARRGAGSPVATFMLEEPLFVTAAAGEAWVEATARRLEAEWNAEIQRDEADREKAGRGSL